jgi:hypothetical protein
MSTPRDDWHDDLFQPRLDQIVNLRHRLVRLGPAIDWDFVGKPFGSVCRTGRGQPPVVDVSPHLGSRLPAALLMPNPHWRSPVEVDQLRPALFNK